MKDYKQFFRGKKITVMGIGLLGRGLGYTKFLAECGADLIVTDLKPSTALRSSLDKLRDYTHSTELRTGKIKFVLGEHRLEDFRGRDMIVKAAGVPLDSPYIAEAKKNNIPIEMDVSLFAKCAPEVMIIGVTGTRGKSMTTTLIYEILKANEKFLNSPSSKALRTKKPSIFLGGNLRGLATLPLLKKVASSATHRKGGVKAGLPAQAGDILVCELDSWQLQGFGDNNLPAQAGISPHISVFTSFMDDHMNYYKNDRKKYFDDKANIFKYQKSNDVLIVRPGMKKFIKKSDVKGKFIVVNPNDVADWKFNVLGTHHRENLACAVEVAKQFGIPISNIKKAVANFKDLEGRMQLLRTYKGIKIYNDNNATTPEATMAGIEALSVIPKDKKFENPPSRKATAGQRKIVLICGGSDKNLPLDDFVKAVNKYCKVVVMIPGTGTEKLITNYKLLITNGNAKDLKEAVKTSLGLASRGDIILFSPAFASFGMFNNEYERNDEFIKIIKRLK